MRYPASEKAEIIQLVEQSHLPAKRTLDKLGIPRATFYRWYDRYREGGPEALADHRSRPDRVWNRIPEDVRRQIIDLALELPELSPRELAVRFTDEKKYFVSEASVYRLLLVMDSTNARIVEAERALAEPIAARPERNRYPVDSELRAKLERDLLDNPIERRQLRVLDDQPKAEIGRRHAGGAAARAGSRMKSVI